MAVKSPPRVDDEVFDALEQLRLRGAAGPDPRSRAGARRAMLEAVEECPQRGWFAELLRWPLQPRRLVGEFALVMLGVLGVLGWSAPAGTPFHGVRMARETITQSISGPNRLDVDLGFAEQYLAEAAGNHANHDAMVEARIFLEDARGLLPADQNDPSWQRWLADEMRLAALGAPSSAPADPHNPSTSGPVSRTSATANPTAGLSATPSASVAGNRGAEPEDRASPRPSASASASASAAPSPVSSSSPQASPTPTHTPDT